MIFPSDVSCQDNTIYLPEKAVDEDINELGQIVKKALSKTGKNLSSITRVFTGGKPNQNLSHDLPALDMDVPYCLLEK